jgi:multidrug resistance efflux pump
MSDISPAANSDSSERLRQRVRSLQLPPTDERRSGMLRWAILAAVIAGAMGAAWRMELLKFGAAAGSVEDKPAAKPSENNTAETDPTAQAQPEPAAPKQRGGIVLEAPGYITPAHRILVSPKVSGMLTELRIEEGMRVKKGDILGVIESIEYEADAKRATANLAMAMEKSRELENGSRPEEIEQARAEWTEAKAKLKQLDADYERAKKLRQVGGVSDAELDAAISNVDTQKQRITRLQFVLTLLEQGAREERRQLAKAEVKQAEAELIKAKWRLDNCTIRSPINGTILKKNAEEGNIVNPVAFNGSFSVCDIADLADLEVDLNIQEREVKKVFAGQRCQVRANAFQDRVYEGVVSRVMPVADRAKGAVPVRVKVTVPSDEEGVYLKPDMSAIVTFFAKEKEEKKKE